MTTIVNASIPGTEVRTIIAQSVKQEYRISVALPSSYATHPEQSYPTVYLPDAYFYFGMVTELTRVMVLCDEFPETIVVGIGYPLHEPLAEVTKEVRRLRTRDLTPVLDPEEAFDGEPGGGAPAFLTFIQSELIPLIEREYRSDASTRVLAGHSAGGLFALYALFHQPDLFAGYSVASPSLYWGKRVTFDYEAACAEGRTSLPVKLYLGIGDREDPDPTDSGFYRDFYQLVERLEAQLETGDVEGMLITMMREVIQRPPEEIELLRSQQEDWAARLRNAPTLPREMRGEQSYVFIPERFGNMRTPTLLLVGGESPPGELENATGVSDGLPDAHVVILPGQRHTAMIMAPEVFISKVVQFLES